MSSNHTRLDQQIRFILEIDKLKNVIRRTYNTGADRHENTAEHSWQVAVMGLLLAEHASEPVDPCHVAKMLLVHDIIEIDAGDTYVYDEAALQDQAEREQAAADRLFGMLPSDQEQELRRLFEEFEARQTADARFAKSVDRVMPMLLNYYTDGRSWLEHDISADMVLGLQAPVEEGSQALWALVQRTVQDAVEKGYLRPAE